MDVFQKALGFTLSYEGGYVNHPADPGGATNKGITQATYDRYRKLNGLGTQSVRQITDEEVKTIYYHDYWIKAKCPELAQKSPALAVAVFDFAVHSGPRRALKSLVQCTNQYKTICDVNEYINKRESFLRYIGRGKSSVFLKGWLNRIKALRGHVKEV